MLIHPDKNKHEKAAEAFNVLDKAYKMLLDTDKRRTFQRVMREAKEVVELKRKKDNEKRIALGQDPLPNDTLNSEIAKMCKELFETIEEKKRHHERLDAAYKRSKMHNEKLETVKQEVLKEDAQ